MSKLFAIIGALYLSSHVIHIAIHDVTNWQSAMLSKYISLHLFRNVLACQMLLFTPNNKASHFTIDYQCVSWLQTLWGGHPSIDQPSSFLYTGRPALWLPGPSKESEQTEERGGNSRCWDPRQWCTDHTETVQCWWQTQQ